MRSQAGSPSPACSPVCGHRRCPLTPLSSPRLVNNVGMVYADSKLKRLLECKDPGQVSEALLGGLHCSPTLCCPLSERRHLAAAGRCLLCCCPLPMAALHHLPCPVVPALQNDPGGGAGVYGPGASDTHVPSPRWESVGSGPALPADPHFPLMAASGAAVWLKGSCHLRGIPALSAPS